MFKGILIFSALIAVSCASSFQFGLYQRDFTNVLSTCKTVQTNIIYFTGKCYLQLDSIAGYLDKVKANVLSQSDNSKVENLLKVGFENSTQYFQTTYPAYNAKYKDFEARIIAIFNKIKPSTSEAQMSQFRAAILDSKMDEVYTAVLAASVQNCGQDSTVCEKTNQILNLNVNQLGEFTIDEFLTTSFQNALKFFEKSYSSETAFENDKQLVNTMLQELKTKGTAGTLVKVVKDLFASQLFTYIRNTYDPKYTTALPIKTRSTSTRTTKSTKEPVTKTTTPVYISMAVYLSVPLAILFIGIVSTALVIVLYYRFTPHEGGKPKIAVHSAPIGTYISTYTEKKEVSRF